MMSVNAENTSHISNEILIDSNSDFDSALGDDVASSTTSLYDGIRDYRVLYGRTYSNFSTTEYWGPNDDSQNEQLDIGHHMLSLLLDNKLFLAPIEPNPHNVIDVGTGTGIWAIDFADQFPSAQVIGTDISPIQPTFVPPNCQFELDNAQLEWTYAPNKFDFVHLRCLFGSIKDWPALYREVYKCTKPGGYIEQLELSIEFKSDDDSLGPDHFMKLWSKTFVDYGEMQGKTFKIATLAKNYIEEAGFVDVVEKKYKVPVGAWPSDPQLKEIGRYSLLYCDLGCEGWALWILSKILGWEYAEIQSFVGKLRKELRNKSNHAYYDVVVVYGRKPEI